MHISKSDLRRKYRQKRRTLSPDIKAELDERICSSLLSLPEYQNADLLLVYSPYPDEINLHLFFEAAKSDQKRFAFPRVFGEDMRFAVCDTSELTEGAYGILEPPLDSAFLEEIPKSTFAVLPCLVADRRGARLGYGKGYYDRFLRDRCCVKVAAIYHDYLIEELPAEEHDIPADIILTEREIIRP